MSNYKYHSEVINNKLYFVGWEITNQLVDGTAIFANPLPEPFKDEYGKPLYRWNGNKPILDPIELTIEEKEEQRELKVEKKIRYKLPKIMRILANDPSKGFDDLKAEIKAIDDEITTEIKQ